MHQRKKQPYKGAARHSPGLTSPQLHLYTLIKEAAMAQAKQILEPFQCPDKIPPGSPSDAKHKSRRSHKTQLLCTVIVCVWAYVCVFLYLSVCICVFCLCVCVFLPLPSNMVACQSLHGLQLWLQAAKHVKACETKILKHDSHTADHLHKREIYIPNHSHIIAVQP